MIDKDVREARITELQRWRDAAIRWGQDLDFEKGITGCKLLLGGQQVGLIPWDQPIDEAIYARCRHEMQQLAERPIILELSGEMAWVLISQLHLVLSHPKNTGESATIARDFIVATLDQLTGPNSMLRAVMALADAQLES